MEHMKGSRVRHIRRRFIEALLSKLTKEELLDLHEHWSREFFDSENPRGSVPNSMFWEFSRYMASVEPSLFRQAARPLAAGDSVRVTRRGCNCSTCIVLRDKVTQVHSTGKEEPCLRPGETYDHKGRLRIEGLVRLKLPNGGYTGCCFLESQLERVDASSSVLDIRTSVMRPPEPGWGIDTPEEADALAELSDLAKRVSSAPTFITEYRRVEKLWLTHSGACSECTDLKTGELRWTPCGVAGDYLRELNRLRKISEPPTFTPAEMAVINSPTFTPAADPPEKVLDPRFFNDRPTEPESAEAWQLQLMGEISGLRTRVQLLVAWAVLASAAAAGALLWT